MMSFMCRMAFVLGLLIGIAGFQQAQAQVTILKVLERTVVAVGLEEQYGNQIIFTMIDNARRGYINSQTYTLNAGEVYRIYAIGDDNRILDIDLEVFDEAGRKVAADNKVENFALVRLSVNRTQRYTMKVKPYRLKGNILDGFYSLVIVRVDD